MLNGIGSATPAGIGTQRGGEAPRVGALAGQPGAAAGGGVATTVGRIVAEGPPVETDRVAALRAAIRGGGYRVDADAIAARMIAGDLS